MSRYGNIGLMPYRGVTRLAVDPQDARQEAKVGWFRAELADGIEVELTASPRVGFHRIRFGEGGGGKDQAGAQPRG